MDVHTEAEQWWPLRFPKVDCLCLSFECSGKILFDRVLVGRFGNCTVISLNPAEKFADCVLWMKTELCLTRSAGRGVHAAAICKAILGEDGN